MAKILRNIEDARRDQENTAILANTTVTPSILTPKMSHLGHLPSEREKGRNIPKPFIGSVVKSPVVQSSSGVNNTWDNITPELESRVAIDQSNQTIPLTTLPADQTPQIETSAPVKIPGCPRSQRTWARTPRPEIVADKKNETLDSTVSELLPHKSGGGGLKTSQQSSCKNVDKIMKLRNYLTILHEINQMSIDDDIKRVKCRERVKSEQNGVSN